MVNLGASTKEHKNNKAFLKLVDDVNSSNRDELQSIFDKRTKYIDHKFPMPLKDYNIPETTESYALNKIIKQLNEIESEIDNGTSTSGFNKTQFISFKTKILYWCTTIFKDEVDKLDNNEYVLIIVRNTVSKHEWKFIEQLYKLGVNFLVITENADKLPEITDSDVDIYYTKENLEFKICTNEQEKTKVFNNTDEVETALYDNKEVVKLIISGIDICNNTSNFYARIYNECNDSSDIKLITNGFTKPTPYEANAIQKFKNNDPNYIVETLPKFIDLGNKDMQYKLRELVKSEFSSNENSKLSGQILYNRMVSTICVINNLFKNNSRLKGIVFYGSATNTDKNVLSILSQLDNITLLILCSDKSKTVNIDNMQILELEKSIEVFSIPTVDNRENIKTLAVEAQERRDSTLFNGDTLGMYRPGQFKKCKTKLFKTTFDEIELWWNKELYMRPGFESNVDTAVIPTIFKVIKGVKGTEEEYTENIKKFACGKTIVCNSDSDLIKSSIYSNGMCILRGTDINKTMFHEQKPFYVNKKLVRSRITQDKNYRYSYIDKHKQEFIFDVIEEILSGKYINSKYFNSEQEFVDRVLNVLLNLEHSILKMIHWFEFYTYNPNLILILNEAKLLSIDSYIVLTFLKLVGFDILIFVPTGYSSIEEYVTNEFVYDCNIIGEYEYIASLDFKNIEVTSNVEVKQNEKSKGFFSRLFGAS